MVGKLLSDEGYCVRIADSVGSMLQDILKKLVNVVLLASEIDQIHADELIPLLKK